MKVFIGFADVAGFASRLGSTLARAGHQVVWINSAPNKMNPSRSEQAGFHEIAPWWFRFSKRLKDRLYPVYVVATPLLYLGKLATFLSGLRRSEVMIFLGCGRLLPGYLDRRLAKWCGRRTVNIYLGSASRPLIIGGSGRHMAEQSEKELRRLFKKLKRQRKRVREIARICDEIVENPLCAQFQPRACVDWFRLGFPSGGELFASYGCDDEAREGGKVIVLHCPSKPRVKGTDRIRIVMERLKAEGAPIEFVEITGMAHAEAMKRLAQCDFVVDQMYSDSPLAGFASEAAWFGKPAVVGGYGWDVLRELPSGEWMAPSAACHPEALEVTVRGLVNDAARRAELGAMAKGYDHGFLAGSQYVERFEKVLRGDVPASWRFDPREICYIHGLGQSEEELRVGLRRYIKMFGPKGLCFEDREDLLQAIGSMVSE